MSRPADVPRAHRAPRGRAGWRDVAVVLGAIVTGPGCVGLGAQPDAAFFESFAKAAEPEISAKVLAQPGCAAADAAGAGEGEARGLTAEALGLAGLSGLSAASGASDGVTAGAVPSAAGAAAAPGAGSARIEVLASLSDRFADSNVTVELVGPQAAGAAALAAAEVAGPGKCVGLDGSRLAVGGNPRRIRFVPAPEPVRVKLAAGEAALAAGKAPEARVAFSAAAALDGRDVPGPAVAIASSYATEGRWNETVAAFSELAPRFRITATVHAGLGDALRRAGRRGEAADAWARAIALAPGAAVLINRVAADPFVEVRPPVAPPAARLHDGRWVVRLPRTRGTGGGSPEAAAAFAAEATEYARCKETFRRSPGLQQAVLGEVLSPWRWSPGEESVCTAVWLRAYTRNRDGGRPEDAGLDDLLVIAQRGYLAERALFDVGAMAHPLATVLLDERSLTRLFEFVAAHRVLHRRQGGWLF